MDNAFPVSASSASTVGELKDLIKTKKTPEFDDLAADKLTLWKVCIAITDEELPILLDRLNEKKKLGPATRISKVFTEELPEETVHIVVQRPPQVRAPVLSGSRPSTPLSGDLHTDIKRITDKFFAPGPIANFLDAFVKGEGSLPTTSGSIHGLPRAWRRKYLTASETQPSLLFMDLPDPLIPDSESRNNAAESILELVKDNSQGLIPVFGVSGCGKTRAVIELLSLHWGFYFNASNDDWGSNDMMTVRSAVQRFLNDRKGSLVVDREANNGYARKMTLLLFLSRLLIFKHCLSVLGSNGSFTSARWTLLQVCPEVLFDQDIFNVLFLQLLNLRHHPESDFWDIVRGMYEQTKKCLSKHGCQPRINSSTRLLVVHDEAQVLGDEFIGSFQSTTSAESLRPLLSPILHAFQDIGEKLFTLITCGTGLSINTLYWVQSSGSGVKDHNTTFKERIIECNVPGAWKEIIEDAEDRLVSWAHKEIKGNLCYEIRRLQNKQNNYKDQDQDQDVESIDNMLGLLMYQRCMFGTHDVVLKAVKPELIEYAFGRIKIFGGRAVTVMDEPFVFKAVENYFVATDPYFSTEVENRMLKSSSHEQGRVFERFMMKVFSETFNTRPLSSWPHRPPISDMCPALVGKVEIVGWREPGLEQGTTHGMMSMEEFMDAHVNHQSTRNNKPVAPFFFPKSKPSGPDLLFFIRIDGVRVVPVFVQMKLHQSRSSFSEKKWDDALSTVSADKIQRHAKNFRKYCPNKVYISMIIAYPIKWCEALLAPSDVPKDTSDVQQVVIKVSDDNFGDIFPKKQVEFIDQLKGPPKRSAGVNDSSEKARSKKQRS
ncbi:hypothetical protein B0O80DRAFT_422126 [Mortierella sp. GBAus27b]|nr:hypothetical protein B0O80DRAFT_422126 [Mortierella sp. GBAus27b]